MDEAQARDAEQAEEIAVLAAQLRSRRAHERLQARRVLQRRGSAVLPAMQSLLQEERRKKRRERPVRAVHGTTIFLLMALFQWYLAMPVAWGLIPVLSLLFVIQARLCAATPAQIEAVGVLAAIDDVRAVGPLLEALEWSELATFTGVRERATRALYRLLPRLRPEDADLLDDRQRACLYRLLRHHPSDDYTDLIVALLGAVAQVGDAHVVTQLERMTRDRTSLPPRERVRLSAQETLSLLRHRLDRAPGSLLRAAEAAPAAGLLHPVAAVPNPDPQQLLRASSKETDL